MDYFNQIMSTALILFAVYGLVTASGILSERSGIVNIGLNGNVIAGVLGALIIHGALGYSKALTPNPEDANFGVDLLSLIISGLFGVIVSYLFSIATITLKGNHVIVGTAINLLMPTLAFVFMYIDATTQNSFTPISSPGHSAEVTVASISGFDWRNLVYFLIATILIACTWAFIRYTRLGLRIWASGENPHALAAAGVNVHRTRFHAQAIVGFLSGVAGGIYLKYSSGNFGGDVGGIGFFALAMLVISQWRIHWSVLVVFIFSMIQSTLTTMQIKLPTSIPKEFMEALPFVVPLLVLPFFRKISNMPKHDGLIYDASQR